MPLATLDVNALEEIVLGKCDSFVAMGIWPAGEKLTPKKWLANFKPVEKEHALYLLSSFTYYNMDMCLALLRGAILSLSKSLSQSETLTEQSFKWKQLLADCLFVPVTGERRSVTDSGNLLAAHLRRELLIPEDKILTVDQLYDSTNLTLIQSCKHLIFFDDFVGSGQQFQTMWLNDFKKDTTSLPSIKNQCLTLNLIPHYCAMIGTEYGMKNILTTCKEVDLHFAHVLPPNVSPLHPDNATWPKHLKSTSYDFVLNASKRANIPESAFKGFHDLGLSIAFAFTIPDATLPIFRFNSPNWSALMEKS